VDLYINVPVGIGAALVTWGIYHKRETPTAKVRWTRWAWRCS